MTCATELILVRHAAVKPTSNGSAVLCGWYDEPLSAEGRQQLVQLKARLAEERGISALYSSTLQRAIATAVAAPSLLLSNLRRLRSLREIHCGVFEGFPIEKLKRDHRDVWRLNVEQLDDDFCWPEGESYRYFRTRVLRAVRAISRCHPGERVLVVTHAGVINQIIGTMRGQRAARWENFRPGNASITRVLWNGCEGEVISFDDRAHLMLAEVAR